MDSARRKVDLCGASGVTVWQSRCFEKIICREKDLRMSPGCTNTNPYNGITNAARLFHPRRTRKDNPPPLANHSLKPLLFSYTKFRVLTTGTPAKIPCSRRLKSCYDSSNTRVVSG